MGGGVKLTEARDVLAAALIDGLPLEANVYAYLPDAIVPPAVLVGWADPWFDPVGLCAGELTVGAELVTVAGRLDAAGQQSRLDELAVAVYVALEDDPEWTAPRAPAGPFALDIGGVTYLAATLTTSAVVDAA